MCRSSTIARSTARICSVVSAGTALRFTVRIGFPSGVLPAGRFDPEPQAAVFDHRLAARRLPRPSGLEPIMAIVFRP
jgi:hypothetical protein